jgi:hypothetical protein
VQALIVEEPSSEPRETKPANLVQLKTSTTALRWSIQLFRIHVSKRWIRISEIKIRILEAKSHFFPENLLLQFCKLKGNFAIKRGKI